MLSQLSDEKLPMDAMISTIIGAVIGGAISLVVTWHYYKRAGDELRDEAQSLHKALNALAGALIQPNGARLDFVRDDHDRITSVMVSAVATATGTSEARAVSSAG